MSNPQTSEALAEEKLRRAIINGQLPTDEFLSQRNLAEMVGAAVITVRAALRSLESDRLIENVPRWGVRIPRESEATIRDRYYVRQILEVEAVRKVAANPQPQQIELLRRLAAKCDHQVIHHPDDIETFAQAHFDLHHAIAECSGSQLLVEVLDRAFYKTMLRFNTRRDHLREAMKVLHGDLVEELISGDTDRAVSAITNHIALGLK